MSNPPPDWFAALEHIAPFVGPFVGFILGKATKGGANQVALDGALKDIAALQAASQSNTLILAEHATLHRGYVSMQTQIGRTESMVNLICGHLGIDGTARR